MPLGPDGGNSTFQWYPETLVKKFAFELTFDGQGGLLEAEKWEKDIPGKGTT